MEKVTMKASGLSLVVIGHAILTNEISGSTILPSFAVGSVIIVLGAIMYCYKK